MFASRHGLAVTPLTCSRGCERHAFQRDPLKARAPSVGAALEAADGGVGALESQESCSSQEVKDRWKRRGDENRGRTRFREPRDLRAWWGKGREVCWRVSRAERGPDGQSRMVPRGLAGRLVASDRVSARQQNGDMGAGRGRVRCKGPGRWEREGAGVLGAGGTTLRLRPQLRPSLRSLPGVCGDWKNHFTLAQSEAFDRVYREQMRGAADLPVGRGPRGRQSGLRPRSRPEPQPRSGPQKHPPVTPRIKASLLRGLPDAPREDVPPGWGPQGLGEGEVL